MPYAVIQLGYAVFGVGDTKELAIEDGESYLDEVDRPIEFDDLAGRVMGSMVLVECTEELRQAVDERGGDIPHDIDDDGVAYLVKEF